MGRGLGVAAPSPAPAGIHPALVPSRCPPQALPRTRGDPPYAFKVEWGAGCPPPHPRGSTPIGEQQQVVRCPSPAPAGIHPAADLAAQKARTLPRTRGDPPIAGNLGKDAELPPPHPRGSTRLTPLPSGRSRPSPAPAGIHPLSRDGVDQSSALPRTRGDPPSNSLANILACSPPPHPRGSTRPSCRDPHPSVPSPAPAGIHPLSVVAG